MRIKLDYDRTAQTIEIPDGNLIGVIGARALKEPMGVGPAWKPPAEAMASPLGSPRLQMIAEQGHRVAIVISKLLRPPALPALLELVLAELADSGVHDSDVTMVLSRDHNGPMPESTLIKRAGRKIYQRFRCQWADPDDYLRLGRTSAGTPVDVTAGVVEADVVIAIGVVSYHQFAGYTGGAETIIPQAAGRETMDALLRLTLRPGAEPGRLAGNPVRADIEEAAAFLPINFSLDVVLDDGGRVAMAAAGNPVETHKLCLEFLDDHMAIDINRQADMVVASCGGAPFDRNLVETLEALSRVRPLAAKEGVIILVGACPEGVGDKTLDEWLSWADHPRTLIERAELNLKPGGHFAAAYARALLDAQVFLVANPCLTLSKWPIVKLFPTAEEALHAAMARLGHSASIWALPKAKSVLPRLKPDPASA